MNNIIVHSRPNDDNIIVTVLGILFLFVLISCEQKIDSEGYVDVEGGKVWYKIYGEGNEVPL